MARCEEFAHLEQHARNGWLWRAWTASRGVPVLGRLLRLPVEFQAKTMALRELAGCRVLEPRDVLEAVSGMLSTIGTLFCTNDL